MPGALDANGIYQYAPDDPAALFDETLNLGQEATSVAVGALRSRAKALEDAQILSGIGTPLVVASGWTLSTNLGRKRAGLAFIEWSVTRAGSAITVGSDGDFTNSTVATFAAGWAPAAGMNYPGTPNSRVASWLITNADIRLAAVAPGITIPTGAGFSGVAVYPQ